MIRKLAILFILLILFIFLQWKSPVKSRINTISDQTGAVSNPGFPTLDRIFNSEHKWKTALPAGRVRTIIATGDIIPARSVNFEVFRRQDFNWPYRLTYQVTQSADITFANLESPEIKKCPLTNEGMIFCGDYRNIEGLKFAGIESTGTALSNLVIKNIRGVRFAFLGFNDISKDQPGISNVDEEKIKTEIAEAKKLSEVVIVAMHWGA